MAGISSCSMASVAAAPTPLDALLACVEANPVVTWPTGTLNQYGLRAAAVLQQERLDTDRLGGFYPF